MNFLDFVIIIPLAWFLFKGFRKGLVIEIASLVALILGIYAAVYFSDFLGNFLVRNFGLAKEYVSVVSFTLIFIGVIILIHFLGKAIEKVVNLMALGFMNKIAGAVFSMLKMLLIISIVIYLFNQFDNRELILKKETRDKSLLYNPVSGIALTLVPKLKELGYKIWAREEIKPVLKPE